LGQTSSESVAKGNKALGFIRRNVGSCPEEVKKQAYLALVRPHLEYASSAWDPHLQKYILQIEMVQRRAARFIKSNYSRDPCTVTTLLEQLELPPLSTRRKIARITRLHKAIHEKVAIPIPSYIQHDKIISIYNKVPKVCVFTSD
jgi:hypothetical protein